MFDFESLSKEFLSLRLGALLQKKAQVSQKYQAANHEEEQCFHALTEHLSAEAEPLMESYQKAVVDRELHELYFAYMSGLRDGIRINDLLEEAGSTNP